MRDTDGGGGGGREGGREGPGDGWVGLKRIREITFTENIDT